MISERSTVKLSAPTPVARRGPLGEALTSESIKEKEKLEPSAVETVPFTLLRRICTPVVLITRSQLAIFASITVFGAVITQRSEEHTSELQSRPHLVCRLLLEKKKTKHFPSPCIQKK